MQLSIKFPDMPSVPTEATLFATPPPAWQPRAIADLARRSRIEGEIVDRGPWLVVEDGRAALEIYQASDSLRYGRLNPDGELQDPGSEPPDQDAARTIADAWVREFAPRGSRFDPHSITEAELLVSRGEDAEPERYVTALHVDYRFTLGDLALLGPGAKMQVAIDRTGEVTDAYRFWREPHAIGTERVITPEEAFDRFARGPMFTDLSDDTARAEVTDARLGYLALPPTEPQSVLMPSYELRGVLATELHPRYEFIAHVPAAEIEGVALKRAARPGPSPGAAVPG